MTASRCGSHCWYGREGAAGLCALERLRRSGSRLKSRLEQGSVFSILLVLVLAFGRVAEFSQLPVQRGQ